MSLEWSGLNQMQARLNEYQNKAMQAVHAVAELYAPQIEAQAKADATWTDRTGNARQGLQGLVEDISATMVAIHLAHGVDYGVFLELAHQGRYAIILPTLESFYEPISKTLQDIFK